MESILKKGNVQLDKIDEINLSKLKKLMRGEENVTEELQAFVELEGPVEQKEGKQSFRYMRKKCFEIYVAWKRKDMEKKKELLK